MSKNTKQISNIEIKDYQRSANIITGEKDSSGSILIDSYERNMDKLKQAVQPFTKNYVSTKTTSASTTATDYKSELEKLKNKILNCLMWKRIASFTLTIFCCISVGINLLVIIFFPIWLGSVGSYLTWVIFELVFGVVIISFSSKDCKMKAPKQITKIKRLSIYYMAVCSAMLIIVGILLITHGFKDIISRIRKLKFPIDNTHMDSIFALGELYFIFVSTLRTFIMGLLIILQRRLYGMCQRYNITEMVDFTKKHMDKV